MTTRSEISDLALCLETAEAASCEAKLAARRAEKNKLYVGEIARVGRTILFSTPRLCHERSYNRAMAFSFMDREHLPGILKWLRERDAFFFDIVPILVDDWLVQPMADDGFHIATTSNVWGMSPKEVEALFSPGIVVSEIDLADSDQLRDFGIVLHHGIKLPGALDEAGLRGKRIEYAAPAWHIYLAVLDGKPIAQAVLYIADGIATLDALDAIPKHRGRGGRAALLRRCVADAARAGCEWIACKTQPGWDVEKIMMGVGFEIVYSKRLYSRETRAHYDQ